MSEYIRGKINYVQYSLQREALAKNEGVYVKRRRNVCTEYQVGC